MRTIGITVWIMWIFSRLLALFVCFGWLSVAATAFQKTLAKMWVIQRLKEFQQNAAPKKRRKRRRDDSKENKEPERHQCCGTGFEKRALHLWPSSQNALNTWLKATCLMWFCVHICLGDWTFWTKIQQLPVFRGQHLSNDAGQRRNPKMNTEAQRVEPAVEDPKSTRKFHRWKLISGDRCFWA